MLTDYDLTSYNTLCLPSRAKYFVKLTSTTKLAEIIDFAHELKLPIIALGAGSNLILPAFVNAVVIYNCLHGKKVLQLDGQHCLLQIAAGENWDDIVQYCVAQDYYGIENLAAIPGQIGAACVQNIGAYGAQLADYVHSVDIFCYTTQKITTLTNKQCLFGYRESVFKRQLQHKVMIVSVKLKLNLKFIPNLSYINTASVDAPSQPALPTTAADMYKLIYTIRQSKLPDLKLQPNVGSFFKNALIKQDKIVALLDKYPAMPYFNHSNNEIKIPTAWLIEQCGWKGYSCDGVSVSQHHSLVLINAGGATATAILSLAHKIIASIKAKFDLVLEIEPIVIEINSGQ